MDTTVNESALSQRAERALKLGEPETIASIAYEFRNTGEIDAALWLLEEAVQLPNVHPGIWNNLGDVRQELGDFGGAVDAYSEAIRRGYSSWVNRGYALEQLERWAEATLDYEHALELDPKDIEALVNLGTLFLLLDDLPRSRDLLSLAASIDPQANWQLSEYYNAIGAADLAEDKIRLAIEAGEKRAYLDLARIRAESGLEDEARSYFGEAIAAETPSAAREFSVYLDGLGLSDEARQIAEAAVERGDVRSYAPLAVILESQGSLDKAKKYYRLAIEAGDEEYKEDLLALETQSIQTAIEADL